MSQYLGTKPVWNSFLFYLTKIINQNQVEALKITKIHSMFQKCKWLKSIDLSNFYTKEETIEINFISLSDIIN